MLVLTRKVGEQILLDDCITIVVIKAPKGAVRLGIEAPPYIRNRRVELPKDERSEPPCDAK